MYVKSIRLENLRAFEKLEFDLQRPDGAFAGWTIFVGGNASGKSTLLKGVGLALIGPEPGRVFNSNSVGWIRRGEKKATASVEIVREGLIFDYDKAGKLVSLELLDASEQVNHPNTVEFALAGAEE